jgi:PAS domain S-box-containing protein
MTQKISPSKQAADLYKRAQAKARAGKVKTKEPLSPEAATRVLHDLRVHQIELEMQNEELRRAQEELEASRARYFDLYDMAPVGYLTLSEPGLILEANLTAAALLGVTRDALAKQPLTRFILRDDQDIYYRYRRQLFETGLPQVCEMRMVRAGADPFWVRIEAALAYNAEGKAQGRAVISDITERKRAADWEQQACLILQLATAEEKERKRIATDLHDRLCQDMVCVKMKLDMLGRTDLPPAARETLGQIGESIRTLIRTTQTITYELSNAVLYELGLIVAIEEWIQKEYKPQYAIEIACRIDRQKIDLPPNHTVMLYRSVRELLTNVAKHARVWDAELTIHRHNDRLRVVVADKGAGFDPADLHSASGSQNHYGLFSVRQRLESLGGTMDIQSRPGKGTCVTLELPLTRQTV